MAQPTQVSVRAIADQAAQAAVDRMVKSMPSREEFEKIAAEAASKAAHVAGQTAAEEAIRGFLMRLGTDPDDTEEMKSLRKDFGHLRASREIKETVTKQAWIATVTLMLSAVASAIWLAVKGFGK